MQDTSSVGNASLMTSATTGATTSVLVTINEYAALIGIAVSILSLIVGVVFKVIELRHKKKQLELDKIKMRNAILEELKEQERLMKNDKTSCN